jgi:hypothetical protein
MPHPQPPPDDDDRRIVQKLIGMYDAPAFVRRMRRVEDAERILIEQLEKKRGEKLTMVRLRIGQLRALAGDWTALRPFVAASESLDTLRDLHDALKPELRMPLEATRSAHRLRSALQELTQAMATFNQRWQKLIAEVDLAPVNEMREGYNKHYLIEKECAVGNSRIARMGFKRLDPLTMADLLRQLPPLALAVLS